MARKNELWSYSTVVMSLGEGGERLEEGIDLARFNLIKATTQAL